MRTQRIAAAVAVALAVGAIAASAGAGAPTGCVPPGSTTLRASGAARLYSRGSALFGCLGTRDTKLGSLRGTVPFPARRIVRYALSSRYAGIDTVDMGVDTLASTVALVDLRTGATVASVPATTPERAPESFVSVSAIAVGPSGVLAWIGERSSIGALKPVYEVHALVGTRNRLLASSATKPTSLRLRGNELLWQSGGQTRSATV